MKEIKLFHQSEARVYFDNQLRELELELRKMGRDVLQMDLEELESYISAKYAIEPLNLYKQTESLQYNEKSLDKRMNGYEFELHVDYSGTSILLGLRPSTYSLNLKTASIVKSDDLSGRLVFKISVHNEDKDLIKREVNSFLGYVETNIQRINTDVAKYNRSVSTAFNKVVKLISQQFGREQQFLAELGIDVNREAPPVLQIPRIESPTIRMPEAKDKVKQKTVEYTISPEIYDHICTTIVSVYQSVEKKASLYLGKHEEYLRDYLLPVLETKLDVVSATGETFNHKGKTDILITYEKHNLFIAECKFWSGANGLAATIDQLFERYITWRDTKVAIVLFVKNKDFTNVLSQVPTIAASHAYYRETGSTSGESNFDFDFHLPGDSGRTIRLRILVFHFPEAS